MKYIIIPMAIIITLFIFGLIYTGETFNNSMQSTYALDDFNGSMVQDGEETSLSFGEDSYDLAINETQGIIAVLIAVSIIGSLVGIRVLGSGLSEMTVKILYNTIFFYGVWALFSVLSMEWLLLIPVGGWLIYFALTGMLSFGIVQQINGGSN